MKQPEVAILEEATRLAKEIFLATNPAQQWEHVTLDRQRRVIDQAIIAIVRIRANP